MSVTARDLRLAAGAGLAVLAFGLATVPPGPARAQGAEVAGDWDCGEIRLFITRLGSIEVIREGGYRAGLFKSAGGRLDVTWDGGGTARLTTRFDGAEMLVSGLGGEGLRCRKRR